MPDTQNRIKTGNEGGAPKAKPMDETIGEKATSTAGAANVSPSDLKQQRPDASQEEEKGAKKMANVLAEKSSDLKSGACALAEAATEKVKDGVRLIAEQAHEGIDRAGAIVRANPGSTLTVAFAVGIGVGLMLVRMQSPPPRKREWWQFAR
jgi:ElaB/YqjD/DUF883 family membrane-anchored ribosome-binding protein